MNTFDHETYLSPVTWRYGSEAMRRIWSEAEKRRLLRRFWVALATAQHEAGLVSAEQLADLRAHQDDIDIQRAAEIEREIHHDLMAEIRTYAEQCPIGGSIIHLGATSMDVEDNVDALRLRQALDLILVELEVLLDLLAQRIDQEAETPAMAFTHIQPAEPTTVGYRLAQYGQDLLADLQELRRVRANLRGKGLKGAVGTSASYAQLLEGTGWTARQLEERVMAELGLEAFPVATQTYPRKQDWLVLNALAGLCASLHKFAFDLRILQSPPFGEWSEPFGARQVGSSAMPFKRNPIHAENIDSLTRLVAALPRVTWDNAALSLLERTLDDSGNRRLVLPEAFLLTDEVVRRARRLVEGLNIWPGPTARNLQNYGVFAATERVLMAAVRAGGDRQELHEVIREHSLAAWQALQAGQENPLVSLLATDPRITRYVPATQIPALMDASGHVGDAPERARQMAEAIRAALAEPLPQRAG
ncbi:adenylosuccinate lyase [Litorilinea aerophila]|uniref:Adenylosuccinate lyase n=1 Tax=Litorilinea aerophila TaxID=1204385 RepID=A0A540VJ63_9CHLR|nr:adenylosuccinate lyase [Litorilinea aerophila]MCC9075620.1 adenylosuccinate lyase [Litorilinea aerophila]GIV79172.1 MAG: adenylosuccinate lyase [Litorilinea sp.]